MQDTYFNSYLKIHLSLLLKVLKTKSLSAPVFCLPLGILANHLLLVPSHERYQI